MKKSLGKRSSRVMVRSIAFSIIWLNSSGSWPRFLTSVLMPFRTGSLKSSSDSAD